MAFYQFDLIDCVLLCPAIAEGFICFEFHGLLGVKFPHSGNVLMVSLYRISNRGKSAVIQLSQSFLEKNEGHTEFSATDSIRKCKKKKSPSAGIEPGSLNYWTRELTIRSSARGFCLLVRFPPETKFFVFPFSIFFEGADLTPNHARNE